MSEKPDIRGLLRANLHQAISDAVEVQKSELTVGEQRALTDEIMLEMVAVAEKYFPTKVYREKVEAGSKPSPLGLACPHTWEYNRKPCTAWGAPGVHGCKKEPGHEGIHVCPCGSRHE